MENIKKCAYAGDKSDEYCCNCNGIEMEMLNPNTKIMEKVPANMCGGYVESTENIKLEPTDTTESIKNINECKDSTEEEKSIVEEIRTLGITKEIQISSSVSKEIRGQWFKVTYSETRTIPEGANLEDERKALWNICNDEVDNQIKSIN